MNPYSILFGKEPEQNINRGATVDEMVESFISSPPSQHIYMITGVRGSGKTVLMTSISSELKKYEDWIIIDINSSDDILKSLGAKLYSQNELKSIFDSLKISLNLFGLGLDIDKEARIFDVELAIEKMLDSLKKQNKKVLITIDEAIRTKYMVKFAGAFQIFLRQDLPVFLVMTGLYNNINNLMDEKNLTFLYRAPKIKIKPLSMKAIARNYKKVLGISEDEASRLAVITKGYPFAFQVLGYLIYKNNGFSQEVVEEYREYLEEYVYDKIWSELSNKDRLVLKGIAECETDTIKDIRTKLEMDTNSFNPYRKRLINQGIIDGSKRGVLTFILPYFKEYVIEAFRDA